jgi:2-oxoisovalerate dehydrogenase E1 component
VVRTPMGGGRGYGPTHSQNLEKHLAGVPGLRLLVLHGRTRVRRLYRALRDEGGPVVVIENQLLYATRADAPLPPGYEMLEEAGPYPATVLRPTGAADLTLVAFGRLSVTAEEVARDLQAREEIHIELIFPLQVSPPDLGAVADSVARTRRLLVVEEGAAGHDLASEVVATIAEGWRGREALRLRRLGARPVAVPSAHALEQEVLPSADDIREACLELFDA